MNAITKPTPSRDHIEAARMLADSDLRRARDLLDSVAPILRAAREAMERAAEHGEAGGLPEAMAGIHLRAIRDHAGDLLREHGLYAGAAVTKKEKVNG